VLNAVRTVSATDAWAVGSFGNGTTGQPLILRWNGHKWAQVASNAWAVGQFVSNDGTGQNFAIHCC